MARALPMVVLLAAGLALAACEAGTNPFPPVPPPKAETVPLPPVSGTPQIWQPGHWEWTGNGYEWTPGKWIAHINSTDLWLPGHWVRNPGRGATSATTFTWSWVPGHWVQ